MTIVYKSANIVKSLAATSYIRMNNLPSSDEDEIAEQSLVRLVRCYFLDDEGKIFSCVEWVVTTPDGKEYTFPLEVSFQKRNIRIIFDEPLYPTGEDIVVSMQEMRIIPGDGIYPELKFYPKSNGILVKTRYSQKDSDMVLG